MYVFYLYYINLKPKECIVILINLNEIIKKKTLFLSRF